jgi:hypothetical protein
MFPGQFVKPLHVLSHLSAAADQKTANVIKKETFGARLRNRPLLGFATRDNVGSM